MDLNKIKIGVALTGSFCTLSNVLEEIENLIKENADIYPIVSYSVNSFDTRFYKAEDLQKKLKELTGKEVISTIIDAEPIGPRSFLDILVIAPCTGNTLAKITTGIADTPVTMACKAHLRNLKPVVISVSTNDALGTNAKNIGTLLNTKNIFFVPLHQDNPNEKPNSLISDTKLLLPTIKAAIEGSQIQPIFI